MIRRTRLTNREARQDLVIREQDKMIRALTEELMAGPRIRELQREDIDAVHGECFRDGESTWCLTHVARYRWNAARCDDWQDFRLTVETVIDRLKEEQR